MARISQGDQKGKGRRDASLAETKSNQIFSVSVTLSLFCLFPHAHIYFPQNLIIHPLLVISFSGYKLNMSPPLSSPPFFHPLSLSLSFPLRLSLEHTDTHQFSPYSCSERQGTMNASIDLTATPKSNSVDSGGKEIHTHQSPAQCLFGPQKSHSCLETLV